MTKREYVSENSKTPSVYLSVSGGFYRIIVQDSPICDNKLTEGEALAAARQMKVQPHSRLAWDGDVGQWFNPGYDNSSIPPCV